MSSNLAPGDLKAPGESKLVRDIRKWADWILEETRKDLAEFYPVDDGGYVPSGYIWARTIPCQNPACGSQIPLVRQFWLSNHKKKKVALYPSVVERRVVFNIVGDGHDPFPPGFDPARGTVSKAKAMCMVCGSTIKPQVTRKLFQTHRSGEQMLAVILRHKRKTGKFYRLATSKDTDMAESAASLLAVARREYKERWGIDPLPDEIMSTPDGREYQTGNPHWHQLGPVIYGMTKWCDLFNTRQKLAMITFLSKIRGAGQIIAKTEDAEYAKALACYMGVLLDRMADKNATLVPYNVVGEKIERVFGRQALVMVWDYVELNPFDSQGWPNMTNWVCRAVNHCVQASDYPASISYSSATAMPYEDEFFDAVLTDPPYYDNIFYASISDFFYVWLKRSVGHILPELFITSLTPKTKEVVANTSYAVNTTDIGLPDVKTNIDYERLLSESLGEVYRVLKPDGIVVLVYTHKSVGGWEALINSILASGLVITGAWPIRTEMKARMTAKDTAALASSIYMVARKWELDTVGFYRDIRKRLKIHLEARLDSFWRDGITGADYFIAAIGSSMEVFARYERIEDDTSNVVDTSMILRDIRAMVANYAINKVMRGGIDSGVSHLTRLYILWRWAYGTGRVHFDEALKMLQGLGIDIEEQWRRGGLIEKSGKWVRMPGPGERDMDEVGRAEMVDLLHRTLLLWRDGRREDMSSLLKESGLGGNNTFYAVAQAISEANPGSDESKLIDGFLSGKERMLSETGRSSQTTLFGDEMSGRGTT